MSERTICGVALTAEQNAAVDVAQSRGDHRIHIEMTGGQEAAWRAAAEEEASNLRDRIESRPEFAKAIRKQREVLGMSLADLAGVTGITKANLSRLENGLNLNPTLDTLRRIGAVLGLELEIGFRHAG